ncbi:MAG: glycosyltransferase family 39 protein [Calditrichaceae bacterium]|nr:glycosyltransferase family 39 protein [Calditrichia bacterium]NUQ42404.1 glycosyltransferase family 39 protein [Calditrichaceae bacterium]
MNLHPTLRRFLSFDMALLAFLALAKLLIHFYTNGSYGLHRDELLYLAMGEHLSWGYLEVPPSIALFAKLTQWIGGDSLFAIRFFPALLGSLVVLLTGLMVWEFGGNRFAMLLAGVAVIIAPVYLRAHTLFQPVAFDQFYWTLGALVLILLIRKGEGTTSGGDAPLTGERQSAGPWFPANLTASPVKYHWTLIGIICGLGLLNKYSMLFWIFGFCAGLLLTPLRRQFLTPWPWIAGGVAFLLFLPNLVWQIGQGWPFFEHLGKLNEYQFSNLRRADFLLGQILIMHPAAFPVWFLGILYFFQKKTARPYRVFGWMYLAIAALLLIFNGKHYYLAPMYPVLFAGGAIYIDRFLRKKRWYWMKPCIITILLLSGIFLAPYGLPLLPVEYLEHYAQFLAKHAGLEAPLRKESGEPGKIPQDFADMFGWEEKVAAIAEIYHALPAEQQAECALLAGNYGQAGAIDFYREKYRLPAAVSFHSSYYLWGPGDQPGTTAISLGIPLEGLKRYYRSIKLMDMVKHDYVIDSENNLPLYLCRHPQKTLPEIWPDLRGFR